MKQNIPSVLNLIVALFFLSILPVSGYALTPSQVFDKVKDSVVVVKTLDAQGKVKMQGSGVLLPSGKVATNCHVVEGGASYQVGRGKQLVRATLYAEDGDKDICILDAKGITGKPAQLGKATNLKVGVPVYAVGAPQGLELSLSDGIVAQLRGGPPPFIQTTTAISPGSSGGGLFDGEGRLVGLTTLYLKEGQNLNFAMPVEWIDEVKPGRKPVAKGRSQTEWVKHHTALMQKKDWQGLLDSCRKWVKSEPKEALAWYGLGIAYGNLNRYDDAIDAYRQTIRIDPTQVEVWSALGEAYRNRNRYDDAIDAYRQALRIDPKNASIWSSLGTTYFALGRYDDAIEAYRQALRISPETAIAWIGLGTTYMALNRYDDAIDAYRQALRIDPKNASIWSGLGTTYFALGRYDDAIEAYRQALRIDPKDASTWSVLGLAYSNNKRNEDAIEAGRQALRIDPENATTWIGLGLAYSNLKRNDDAIEAYLQALRIDPKNASTWMGLGSTYLVLGNHDQAIDAYRQALRIDPKNAIAWLAIEFLYSRPGNRAAALEAVKELRHLDPARADDLFKKVINEQSLQPINAVKEDTCDYKCIKMYNNGEFKRGLTIEDCIQALCK